MSDFTGIEKIAGFLLGPRGNGGSLTGIEKNAAFQWGRENNAGFLLGSRRISGILTGIEKKRRDF